MPGIGCYPGSFNPPTVAHLAVAEAAHRAADLDRLDLVVSRVALGKEDLAVPTLADRLAVLEAVASTRPWLGVVVTDAALISDIARGYDAVVMGADKWRQVNDPAWYGTDATSPAAIAARDAAVHALPTVLVAPRAGDGPDDLDHLGGGRVVVLEVDDAHRHVSATDVRDGADHAGDWMLPEAAAFDAETGAWTDPDRYRAGGHPPGEPG